MRDLRIVVPADCVSAIDLDRHRAALDQMRTTLKADISPSGELDLDALAGVARAGGRQS
jgi:hypothetical protein